MARVLYVHSRRNTFTRIDLEALRERFEVDEYFQPGPLPHRELIGKIRRADVVFGWFASWHTLSALTLAKLFRKPTVLIIGGFDTAAVPEINYGNQQDRIRGLRARLAIRRADRLITNSNYLEGEIERNLGIPPERVRVVHHGLPDRFGDPGEPQGDGRVALTVGAVHTWNLERKGHRAFVEAARELPDVEFVLAGGWDDEAIEKLRAVASDNVTFTGYLSDEDLDAEFRRAGVYVQASWHEGFGLAVAEAMLAGCVPVVTDAGALPEVVGDTGVTIPAVDAGDIAAGVREAIGLWPEKGLAARERVLQRFPLSARADGICAEVQAALESR